MAKRVMVCRILIVLSAAFAAARGSVFSQERTDWFSLGFELGNYRESYEATGDMYKSAGIAGAKINSSMTAPGIALGGYSFWGSHKAGFFAHGSFLFPGSYKVKVAGYGEGTNKFNSAAAIGLLIGPGFRAEFTDKFKMHFALGLDLAIMIGTMDYSSSASALEFDFLIGLGGDVGFKFDVSNGFYFDIGTLLTLDFARHSSLAVSNKVASRTLVNDWLDGYFGFTARPYFCIGFNFYKENGKTHLGKAAKTEPKPAG